MKTKYFMKLLESLTPWAIDQWSGKRLILPYKKCLIAMKITRDHCRSSYISTSFSKLGKSQANHEIRTMAFWKATRMLQYGGYWHESYVPNATNGAPTYLETTPYIWPPPPPTASHLGPLPHPLNNTHMLATRIPSSPDSPPERPTT